MSRKQDVAPGNWDLTPLNPTWIIYKPISTSNQIKPIQTYESRSVARIIGSASLGPIYSVNFTNQGHNSNLPSMLTIKKGRQWKSQEDYRKEERKSPCLGRQGVEKSNWLKAVEGRSWLAAWLHQPQMKWSPRVQIWKLISSGRWRRLPIQWSVGQLKWFAGL